MHLEDQVNHELKKLKSLGIIRPSESSWRSSLVVVSKDDNKIRICVDYRVLNEITKKMHTPYLELMRLLMLLLKQVISQ